MKRIICILLLMSFTLSLLCACNDRSVTTDEKPSPTPSLEVTPFESVPALSGRDVMSLLPVSEEKIVWYTSNVVEDAVRSFEGIKGTGTLYDVEQVNEGTYIAFIVYLYSNEFEGKSYSDKKVFLEVEGLEPLEETNERYYFCIATREQMAGLSGWLKERLWIEVSTKETFVNYVKCEE